ncbi:polysaccharide deacetylase family protein [Rhizohabitans arisaemae]|uniref:polysaccharide deacetylase family protein n=1 Tax=Rhizohabitans arisaemae TaxID=2720610 RepID=UPI0024B17D2F|nr:polysaccharide deacetylase family protein [Rhizohabitans arisaemae]
MKSKCIALTFDDGPGKYTNLLLTMLAKHQARATFFVVGANVVESPRGLLLRMVREGHELANHTWDHPSLPSLPPLALRSQLRRTQEVVMSLSGVRMTLMRPPYGATDARVAAEARRQGLAEVMWSIDTMDWRDRDSSLVARRTLRNPKPGAIVLYHDIHPTTIYAIPRILQGLERQGFTFVTVSELYGERKPQPGARYFKR